MNLTRLFNIDNPISGGPEVGHKNSGRIVAQKNNQILSIFQSPLTIMACRYRFTLW